LVGYAAITVALTWPLILSPGRMVPSDLGDPLLTTSILWWNAQQLPFSDAWWNGTFFFPAGEGLALSDHRVGIGLFATPLIWLGASPLAAYGLTFLLTWWLSALSAYALVWTLTSNRAASFIGGLVFGFNPFRTAHLPHLELLAAYCLPIILVALHQWRATRRNLWLLLLSVALTLQALTSGYYFFFMAPLVALWLVWFARGLAPREYGVVAIALGAPMIVMSPVLAHYRQVHQAMGLTRSIDVIKHYSADLIGLLTAPEPLALWNSPQAWHRSEGEIMPGLVAVGLVVAAAAIGHRQTIAVRMSSLVTRVRWVLLCVAIAEIGVAIVPVITGPVAFTVAGIRVSTRGQDKPLSVAFLCVVVWLVTSKRFVSAFRSRSRFAFYCVAAALMWLLALGPEGRFMGHPVLYKAPYSWLMLLPGFSDSFRVPARFAMLAALALAAAAGLAAVRLTVRVQDRTRVTVMAALVAAILAESWIYPFPLPPAPAPLELPAGVPASAVVLELPIGIYEDALAMFHATVHHRRTMNGMSGYDPPHYQVLRHALGEGHIDFLAVPRRDADIVVFSRRDDAGATALTPRLRAAADAMPLHDTATHYVTLLKMQPAQSPATAALAVEEVPPATITAQPAVSPASLITDDDPRTAWFSDTPQTGTEMITLALSEARAIAGIRIAVGAHISLYPRAVAVDVSEDGQQWQTVATADGATAAFEAALRDATRIDVTIRFEPRRGRHVRIRQTGRSGAHWAVAELRVLAGPVE
jgi:hypothetical protein